VGRVTLAALLAVFACAAPAQAAGLRPGGSVVVRWHSNPETCAQSGLCDRSGSLVWRPDAAAAMLVDSLGDYAFVDVETSEAVARSNRTIGDAVETCIDRPDVLGEMVIGPTNTRTVRVSLRGADDFSFGRCAGPLADDFLAAMPVSKPVATAQLGKGALVDMRGRKPFAATPFSGEVVSTLVLRPSRDRSRSTSSSGTPPAVDHGPRARYGQLAATYAITGLTGDLGWSFGGAPGDACAPFDTCGLSGDLSLHAGVPSGRLTISSVRRVGRGRHETVASGLAALRRSGTHVSADAELGDFTKLPPTVAIPADEIVTPAGGATCSATAQLGEPVLFAARTKAGLSLRLQSGGNTVPDPLRTRCPGPATGELGLDDALAAGALPLATIGAKQAFVQLRPASSFDTIGFSGTGHGAMTLSLRLVSLRASTRTIRVPHEMFP
jgi:hypothetical protein